jgi:hypothetical protein
MKTLITQYFVFFIFTVYTSVNTKAQYLSNDLISFLVNDSTFINRFKICTKNDFIIIDTLNTLNDSVYHVNKCNKEIKVSHINISKNQVSVFNSDGSYNWDYNRFKDTIYIGKRYIFITKIKNNKRKIILQTTRLPDNSLLIYTIDRKKKRYLITKIIDGVM